MMKSAFLLTIAALGAALNRADALRNPKGNEIAFADAGPHSLARDELLARAIACEDMLCLERELDDKLIHSAVRPFMIIRNAKKEKEDQGAGARSSCCPQTPCYLEQCKNTCNYWQNNGGLTPCGDSPCGYNSFTAPTEPGSTDTQTCYKPGERSQGADGYEQVSYKPCCDGRAPVDKIGQWGKFCPDEYSGDDGGNGGDGGDGGDNGNGSSECYGPGMRSMGDEGYPAVEYKPCCDGRTAVKRASEWGMFCPAASGGEETSAGGTGYGEDEAQEGTPERYAQAVRTSVLQLTRSCARMQDAETVECMQRELDSVLARASQDGTSDFSGNQCCLVDDNYYCLCRNTCYYWQNNRFAAPEGLLPPSDEYYTI